MNKKIILEGSLAIAETIKNIRPDVVAVYPITPQTHILEALARFKNSGQADFQYLRAESEFAAASMVLGAAAAGSRTYTATSSQGLLLMTEVIYNIAGLRLPIVMTLANRAIGAPINIWNDHQDAMSIRDAGWIMLFAEDNQEAINLHIIAYKLTEKLNIPVMVNVDGFILTHAFEPVIVPTVNEIKKYLGPNKIKNLLNPSKPESTGLLATPQYYQEIRQKLHDDLSNSTKTIKQELKNFSSALSPQPSALIDYVGPKSPDLIFVAMGSVVGTIKHFVKTNKLTKIGILKITCFRPFPANDILPILKCAKRVAVLDKAISLGQMGPLANDIKSVCQGRINAPIKSFITGLGGRDITGQTLEKIIKNNFKNTEQSEFI